MALRFQIKSDFKRMRCPDEGGRGTEALVEKVSEKGEE